MMGGDTTIKNVLAKEAGSQGAPQITPDKSLQMAGIAPLEKEPEAPKFDLERNEIKAQALEKAMMTYRKYGQVEKAEALKQHHLDGVLKIAAIDHKAGQKLWNNSKSLVEEYGEVDLKPKDKFKVVGDHGNYVKVNESTGDVFPITSVGELKGINPEENVYMKVTDKDGKVTWTQIQFAKQKAETGDNLRKYDQDGFTITEEKVNGKWQFKAKSPIRKEGGEQKSLSIKEGLEEIKNAYIQRNAGDMINDEERKSPDFNTFMAKKGQSQVGDKINPKTNKPLTQEEHYRTVTNYYEKERNAGKTHSEAMDSALRHGESFGEKTSNKYSFTPEEKTGIEKGEIRIAKGKDGSVKMFKNGKEYKTLTAGSGVKQETRNNNTQKTEDKKSINPLVNEAHAAQGKETPKNNKAILIPMNDGRNINLSASPAVAETIQRKVVALDKLVRQGGLTPQQRDEELRAYAQAYIFK